MYVSALRDVLGLNVASLRVSCTDDAFCYVIVITKSFQEAWGMTFTPLTSHDEDVSL